MRILRDGNRVYEQEDVLIIPKLITFGEHIKPAKLYNYFIFSLNELVYSNTINSMKIFKFVSDEKKDNN